MTTFLRRALTWLALVVGAVLVLAGAAATALLTTNAGAKWAVALATRSLGSDRLSVREVRGTLASPLELRGVLYRADSLSVGVDRLAVRWDLQGLLSRRLDLESLEVDGLRVSGQASPKGPGGAPPAVALPDLSLPLSIHARKLLVRDFRWVVKGDSAAFVVDEVRSSLDFDGERLRLRSLNARAPLFDVDLKGQVRPRGDYPCDFELGWALRLPEWPEARGRGKVAGSIRELHVVQRLEAPSEARLDLLVSRPLEAPLVDGRLEFARVKVDRLARGAPPVAVGGTIEAHGTLERYTVAFDGTLASQERDWGRWRAIATGTTSRLEVRSFEGPLLGGRVSGKGLVIWEPRLRWEAAVRGRGLDPGRVRSDWPGSVDLEVTARGGQRGAAQVVEARLARLAGALRGLPISGRGRFSTHGRSWRADSVDLSWGDARLRGSGAGGERWNLSASIDAPSLRPLIPGASGALQATLDVSGPRRDPRVDLALHGDSLAWENVEARALSIHLEGTRGDHRLHGEASVESTTLSVEAAGGYRDGRWRGVLESLDLRSRLGGAWKLEAPVAVNASAKDARVDRFCLRSAGGSLCGRGAWRAPGSLDAEARLDSVPLDLLGPWLPPGARLVGTIDGSLDLRREKARGPMFASVRLRQSPSLLIYAVMQDRPDTLRIAEGHVELDADGSGARGALRARLESGDHLDATFALPGFDLSRPDATGQPIHGKLDARVSDLSALSAAVPGLSDARGDVAASLTFTGKLSRPEIAGGATLSGGQLTLPTLGITVLDVAVAVRAKAGGGLSLEGSARSGKGTVALTGTAVLDETRRPVVDIAIKGKDFTVADRRGVKITMTPDLRIKVDPSRVDVTGQVEIPFARITAIDRAKELPNPPSPDVVILGAEKDSARTSGNRLHARVRVVLGEDVEVRLPNFRGKPEGSVVAIEEPGQETRATGELKVPEGIYRAYGSDLHIERGRLIYAGGRITNPGLDLRASRRASDGTVAGIQVSGTAELPEISVFSEPQMAQAEALSYIMFGEPLSESGGGAQRAAGQLGVQGADVLARGAGGKLGIPGATVESKESLQEAALFVGTYLSPKLYMSYGIGLFNSETTLRLRYAMTKRWSVQTESGESRSGRLQYSGEH